jgi:hypothetical protein
MLTMCPQNAARRSAWTLVARVLLFPTVCFELACSPSAPEKKSGQSDSVPITGHDVVKGTDSVGIVRVAAAALHDTSGGKRYRVTRFEPSDSGYLVSLVPVRRDSNLVMRGGGALVLVSAGGSATVLRTYR